MTYWENEYSQNIILIFEHQPNLYSSNFYRIKGVRCIIQMKIKTFNRDQAINSQEELHSLNIYQSNFILQKGICEYRNQVTLEQAKTSNNSNGADIEIKNQVCKVSGQSLEKITIIKLNGKQVTIRDRYDFSSEIGKKISSGNKLKRKEQLFKKSMILTDIPNKGKKMTKNLAKNFIKAFFNYLRPIKEHSTQQMENKIKALEKRKYNNSLIKQIAGQQSLKCLFQDFLSNYSSQWIKQSKIKDKQLHFGAIKAFQTILNSKNSPQIKNEQAEQEEGNFGDLSQQNVNYQYIHDNRILSEDLDKISLLADAGNSANLCLQ